MHKLSFLVVNGADATGTALPDEVFAGYYFHATDFISGPRGYAAFRKAGGPLPEAEDGCYVHGLRTDEDLIFSADYCGYHKLFYIHRPGFWAVSNSLWQIAHAMRRAGLMPEPDLAQLAAVEAEGTIFPTGRGMFFAQMSTFDTVIQGVKLLPHRMRLRIGPSGARLEALPPRAPQGSYADALSRELGIWVARIATLAAQDRLLHADLTGGLDSRTVLSILLAGSGGEGLFLNSATGARQVRDLKVAQSLSARLSLPLNQPLPRKPPALGPGEAFEVWRDLCLGAYHPIYFPRHRVTNDVIHFGGCGGGNQRSVYDRSVWARLTGMGQLARFIPARMRNLRPAAQRAPFGAALRATIARLTEQEGAGPDGGLDPLVLHYRAFRNRLHGGRTPQYLISFNPIASALFDDCAALAGPERITRAQLFYDILESLRPGLANLPFDKSRKSPTPAIIAGLTRVTPSPQPLGQVFAPRPKPGGRPRKGPSPYAELAALYARARPLAAPHLATSYLRRADRELAFALRHGRFSWPARAKRIGVVTAFALFDPTAESALT
ncbi:hypothetical protein [Gemmobacter serpentinus]|uniref:hypothetical protein n=1 Tax=Gemmobacter serpentinus TaxID=2652247 RepID=UPI00124C0AF7|nr:hypothetical protein [Gemmobacter serpentinus]